MKTGQTMLVPSGQIIEEFIRTIPKGSCIDFKTLRSELALKYGAEVTCPITTGILLRTIAEAAYEAYEQSADLGEVTPVWRVLDQDSPTTKKLTCGPGFIAYNRIQEGIAR